MALDENICKIQEIISSAETELKSIEVVTDIPLELDIGNLLASDTNELDKSKFSNKVETEEYFQSLARDGVQSILNAVWELPTETIDNSIFAKIPKSTTILPREKPVPKAKPMTKWEQFAKEKGIQKKKQPPKVWDDILKEWVPRFGFLKAQAERKKNWMMEVPENADPYEDQFHKMSEKKKERIARNEFLRMQNIGKANKINVPNVGVTSVNIKTKASMKTALEQTRLSTASLGKFQKSLPKETPIIEAKRGQKRKLPASDNSSAGVQKDKKRALQVLNKMKKGELDYESSVNKQIRMENIEMSHKGKKSEGSGRRSKKGGRQRGKSEYKALSKGINKAVHGKAAQKVKNKVVGGKMKGSRSKSGGGGGKGGKSRGGGGGGRGGRGGKGKGKKR